VGVWRDRSRSRIPEWLRLTSGLPLPFHPSAIVHRVLSDLREEALADHSLFDVRAVVLEVLASDRKMAVDTMIEMGRPELTFIRNSGALMGGAFGLLQLALWTRWPQRDVAVFTMPAFGCETALHTPHKPTATRHLVATAMTNQPTHQPTDRPGYCSWRCGRDGRRKTLPSSPCRHSGARGASILAAPQ
jgi:hypothetical protein